MISVQIPYNRDIHLLEGGRRVAPLFLFLEFL